MSKGVKVVLGVVIGLVLLGLCSDSSDKEDAVVSTQSVGGNTPSSSGSIPPPIPAVDEDDWSTVRFVDAFGEVTGTGAVSESVGSVRPMGFPYHNTRVQLIVNCDDAWVRFSESPNITGGSFAPDGDQLFNVIARVDGQSAGQWQMFGSTGEKDLHFMDDSQAIAAMSRGSTFGLAFEWYSEGMVAFTWSLKGSTKMIRSSCE